MVAAAAGALARTQVGRRWNRPRGLALGTLIVNVTGSFLLGLVSEVGPPAITIIGVGGLGAYTTFSSFARDAVALVEQRHAALAVLYVSLTCTLAIGAAAVGVGLATA